jgi:hypothetical protein
VVKITNKIMYNMQTGGEGYQAIRASQTEHVSCERANLGPEGLRTAGGVSTLGGATIRPNGLD